MYSIIISYMRRIVIVFLQKIKIFICRFVREGKVGRNKNGETQNMISNKKLKKYVDKP